MIYLTNSKKSLMNPKLNEEFKKWMDYWFPDDSKKESNK